MNLLKDKALVIYMLTIMVMLTFVYLAIVTINLLTIIVDLSAVEHKTYITVVQNEINITEEVTQTQPKPVVKAAVSKVKPKPVVVAKPKPKVIPKKVVYKEPERKMDEDTYLLAQLIDAEAKGEPYTGKVAVGNVVLNRVKSPEFPDTVKEVIFQKGQFSPVTNGSIHDEPTDESIRAAKEAMNGREIVSNQALYFYNPNTSTSDWIFSRKTIMDIGNHRFAY